MSDLSMDLAAARPKGRRAILGLLGVATVGAAAWLAFGRDPGPRGDPEDASRILLVATDDPAVAPLEQMGFAVEQRSLAEFAGTGRQTDAVDVLLRHADERGFGYVVFADPSEVEFGSRAVHPDSATIESRHRYAVFSVGEFADPVPKVTVDPVLRPYAPPIQVELVAALFEQDKLAATLVGEHNLSIEARPLFERIEPAVEFQGAYGLIDRKVASATKRRTEYVVDSEEADPSPALLGDGIERTHAYALSNGSALLLVESPVLRSPASSAVELEWTGDTRAWVQDLHSGERTRCEAGDRIDPRDGLLVHAAGSALLSSWGHGSLMVWTVDHATPGCALVMAGTVRADLGPWGRVYRDGRVVRARRSDGGFVAEVHTPDQPHPVTWPLPGCTDVGAPIWLDHAHLAAPCEVQRPSSDDDSTMSARRAEHWIYLLSLDDGSSLALPLQGTRFNPTLHLRPSTDALVLLAEDQGRVTSYAFDAPLEVVVAQPPLDPGLDMPAFVADPAAGVRALRPNAATVRPLESSNNDETINDIVVAPDGSSFVFGVDQTGRFDDNLAVYTFSTGHTHRIAINEWARHSTPSYSPDGRTVVFNSTYSTAGFGRATVAQRARLANK